MTFEPGIGGHIVDRYADGWQSMRDAVGRGWSRDRYTDVAAV